jgi:hypothetical protein
VFDNTVDYSASGAGTVGYEMDWVDTETIQGGTSGATAPITNSNTGATFWYDYDTSSVKLQTGIVAGQRVVRQTNRYFSYFPGFDQFPIQTFVADPANGKTIYVLYGDDLNAIGLRVRNQEASIMIRSNIGGTVKETFKRQEQWEGGKLADFNFGHILGTAFKWLGYGNTVSTLTMDEVIDIVNSPHAGFERDAYMRTPTLPLRVEILNHDTPTETSELRQVCSAVFSEGGFAIPGLEFTKGLSLFNKRTFSGTAGVEETMMAVRLKKEFPTGKPNQHTAKLLDIALTAQVKNATGYVYHVHDVIAATGGTWVSVDANSSMEINTGITAVSARHFHTIQQPDLLSGQAGKGDKEIVDVSIISNHGFISQNIESDNSQMFLISIEPEALSPQVSGHFSWIETE